MSTYPRQRSSIFSGLLLILLGILFLLERFDPQLGIGHLLRHYWPVLLILWGVAKLIDHLAATRSGEVAPPILTGGEAALIILLVLVLAAMSGAEWIHSKFPNIQIQFDGANRHASQSVALPPVSVVAGEQITVQTSSGDIHVHAGNGMTLHVNADESAPGSSEESAQQRLRTVRVVIEKSGGGYVIHPVDQDGIEGSVNINLDVEVPPQVNLTAISKNGDIMISGLAGNVTATAQHGDVDIHNCSMDVTATLQDGDAHITKIGGNVQISGHGGDMEAGDIGGNASLAGGFSGSIRMRNVAKTSRVAIGPSSLTVERLTGRLELDSDHLEIADVGGAALLATRNKDMDVENVSGKLDVADVHGDVTVVLPKPPTQPVAIADESGEVDLSLPGNSNFQIMATSKSGEVQSDFDSPALRIDNSDSGGRLEGAVGAGGPAINVATSYGTIYLRKSS